MRWMIVPYGRKISGGEEPAGEIHSVLLFAEMVFLCRKMMHVSLEVSFARYAFWISGAKCCTG